ncbi:hypothetical protein MUY27_01130 [Mucilaginibacter sp. RS28]|uniref:Uncharacterized protein n=1 Tax=Mucilaginibacter straminoryzae TaxID=2932774 RepID=A0A9X2B828_9SPHI|nr:hypothetical protein [Mucilaginibacter straminoryzae]MCJ8208290.1 hypothetical protein [Mucilaginibacter straminoryzae]
MMLGKKSADFALLVHACDRYSFLYPGFAYFFDRYWDKSIPCNYYFATEELQADIPGFENIRSGKGEWSDRLALLLREQIKERYVIYMQEDMWLSATVNAAFFEQLLLLIQQHNWKQVKLTSAEVYKTRPTDWQVEGFTISRLDNEQSDYLMSHQMTIWDREFLLQQLPKNEHPWRNERKGTKRLKRLNPEIYQVDYFAENGNPQINKNENQIPRSAYFTVSENSALNSRVLPFIEQLKNGDAAAQAYAAQLQQHYDQQLTHDGLPKPRKVDPVKRLKNWLTGK